MTRHIKDSNLIEEIKSLKISVGGKDIFPDEAKESVLRVINEQPTADVAEVKHGEWVVNSQCNHKPSRYKNPEKWVTYKCSECGYSNGRKNNANFCPRCGAKMDRKGDT